MVRRGNAGVPSALAAEVAGVSYRQLDYWIRQGVLTPSISDAAGSGTQRRFTPADVDSLATLARLRRLGAPLKVIRAVRGFLADEGPPEPIIAVHADGSCEWADSETPALDLCPGFLVTFGAEWPEGIRLDDPLPMSS